MDKYRVVLEGTGIPPGNFKGVRTIEEFISKDEFDYRRKNGEIVDNVVAEGVSPEEAQRLFNEVPIDVLFESARVEASYGGKLDDAMFDELVRGIVASRLWANPGDH